MSHSEFHCLYSYTAVTDVGLQEEYEPALQRVFGDALGSLAISRYPLSLYKNNTAAAFIQAYADAMVVCPSIAFVTMLQSLMAIDKVYHYIFAYGPEYTDQAAEMRLVSPMQKTSRHWASHGAELPFLFHNMCRRCRLARVSKILYISRPVRDKLPACRWLAFGRAAFLYPSQCLCGFAHSEQCKRTV